MKKHPKKNSPAENRTRDLRVEVAGQTPEPNTALMKIKLVFRILL